MVIFMSYCASFWGSGMIYKVQDILVHVWGTRTKTLFSHFIIVLLSYCQLFWSSREIYKPHHNRYMLERHDQKIIFFCVFWKFSWATAHSLVLGFRGDFQGPRYSGTCLRDMYKKHYFHVLSSFSWTIAHFFGILGQFTRPMTLGFWVLWLVSWAIADNLWFWYNLKTPQQLVHVWKAWPITNHFTFYWRFHELLPIVLGFWCDFTWPMTLGTCLRGWPKTRCFLIFDGHFHELLPIVLAFRDDLQGPNIFWYMFERHVQKSDVFTFYCSFLELLCTFLEF
jgi:hypothetical protein